MEGDSFDNIFGTQSRGRFQQQRASGFDQFWHPSRMRHPASPNDSRGDRERAKARKVEEIPAERTVRTILVEDGGAMDAPSRKAPPQAPRSQKAPQAPRAPQGRKPPGVRFESSDAAASKIQTVYRGYSVRRTEPLKHLRLIRKVKSELQELVSKSCRREELEKLRDDPQVRLRWTEGVMALILRLDSLQGVHPVVRVIRKSMAKDLIRFQGRIDSIADADGENLVVDDVDAVEEDLNVEAGNKDVAIAKETNVPDLETKMETALETEGSSDSSVSSEQSNEGVSSLSQMTDIADNLQVESTFEAESLIGTPENLQKRLTCRVNNPEVANEKEAAECTYLSAGDLEQAVSTSTEDQELSTSAVDASNDAMVVANPSWTSLITEPRQSDSLSDPPTTADVSSLSDRALLLQILEENRKLKAVFGEVLQWGKQQNEVINKLTSRVKQLEGGVSNVKLSKDCVHSSRKGRQHHSPDRRQENTHTQIGEPFWASRKLHQCK